MISPAIVVHAKLFTDSSSMTIELPVLMTNEGIIEPLMDYCLDRLHARSLSWMKKLLAAARLLFYYSQCNDFEQNSRDLLRNFALRLYSGTFDATGIDPCGLCWKQKPYHEVAATLGMLNDFFEWLENYDPGIIPNANKVLGSRYDEFIKNVAYEYRREKAFLGHTWTLKPNFTPSYFPNSARSPFSNQADPPAFPEDRFMDLITEGFRKGGRLNLRDILITLLLNGAGFRVSETFHLYICDVFPDPQDATMPIVSIHHPVEGKPPADWCDPNGHPFKGNRAAYLSTEYGLLPRNEVFGSLSAGWKGGFHDDKYYKRAYWFPKELGQLFLKIWYAYLQEIALIDRNHPFAFVNLRRGCRGAPYTIHQFNKSHAIACRRIGLIVSKAEGTTPHGHRHAFGRRLSRASVSKDLIRRFMHHSAIESQEVYTQPSRSDIMHELNAAQARMTSIPGSYSNTIPESAITFGESLNARLP